MSKNKITAVLGPTNTGKTHLAIETMLSFETGMIGFPLRLLAREVYDKVVKKNQAGSVALITGEEKILPPNAKYFLCTVESMPIDKDLEFVGVDEIQMCTDHERGHIFTDRLLNFRGKKLTMFLGSQVMENLIPYIQEEISKGTQLNHIMRHTVGLFHGQNGSRVWKQYLSKNMCIRDADLQKVNHIMDQVKKTNPVSLER